MSDWQYKFSEKKRITRRRHYLENREALDRINKKYLSDNPWRRVLYSIRSRCTNPRQYGYRWYGGKGIKCKITAFEIKKLWFRDKAFSMKCPSIDRIDSAKDYKFSNCRFIERSENSKRASHFNHVSKFGNVGKDALALVLIHHADFYQPIIDRVGLMAKKVRMLIDFSQRLNFSHKEILRHAA